MRVPVRPAVPADAPEIAACLAALGYGTPASLVADRLAAFETSAVDAVFVAEGAAELGLVGAAEAWAWDLGARRVEVTSGDHRPAAHAFYQALGYAPDERRFVKPAPTTPRDD